MLVNSRLANEQDFNYISDIYSDYLNEIKDHRGSQHMLDNLFQINFDLLSRLKDNPDFLLLVGTFEEVVLGFAICELIGDRAVLQFIVVSKGARKVGIGSSMLNKIVSVMKSKGIQTIDSQVMPGERHSKNFFESFGMKARLIIVSSEL